MSNDFKMAIVDVETTGLSPWRHDRIVEIAIVVVSPDGVIHKEYETLINPERDMGPSRIHQISAAEVLNAPKFGDVAHDIADIFRGVHILAGHNITFDRNFLIEEFKRCKIAMPTMPIFCTLNLSGSSLGKSCADFGVDFDGAAHHAINDARATAVLALRMIEEDQSLFGKVIKDINSSKHYSWPRLSPRRTPCISRDHANKILDDSPAFMRRIVGEMRHDTEASPPNVLTYLTLIDRVLEDRVIDEQEEAVLIDAIENLGLSRGQIQHAHENYIYNLAVRALADGVVTDAEYADLHAVCRLLGYNRGSLDETLKSTRAQLESFDVARGGTASSHDLHGKRVCFTGELRSKIDNKPIKRPMAEALAEQAGLLVASSVTKKLDILVVADPHTQSGKARKARNYGTRIIAEPAFWTMIGVDVQ
ncbi:MAG: exonuclease domain-containing protein [Gammaproteobacteria bacterium]|nr:exonuclease domain-containing protein [Gammaproteobacteria bacterium]